MWKNVLFIGILVGYIIENVFCIVYNFVCCMVFDVIDEFDIIYIMVWVNKIWFFMS